MVKEIELVDLLNQRSFGKKSAYYRPRDAATLILLRFDDDSTRILMGKRHEKHKFMPGKFVFPGGRVDFADSRVVPNGDFPAATMGKLLKNMKRGISIGRARALGMAAIREAFEEAGVLYGASPASKQSSRCPSWQEFLDHGVSPSLSGLNLIARAITPPGRPRRFDTRFFAADARGISRTLNSEDVPTNELLERCWLTFDEAFDVDLPLITQVVLKHLKIRLDKGKLDDVDYPTPFYFHHKGRFLRNEL
jgi:8-oxo-dGTP pyrophosphatase MutT (NUDIX family)